MTAPTFVISPENLAQLSGASVRDFSGGDPLTPLTPLSRLFDDRADLPCRVENTLDPNGSIALYVPVASSPDGVRVVALFGLNLPANHAVTVLLYTDSGLGTLTAFTTATTTVDPEDSNRGQLVVTYAEPIACGFAVVVIPYPTTTGWPEYWDIGELWIGRGYKPERGITFETEPGLDDASDQLVSVGQQIYAAARTPARVLSLSFPALTEVELFGSPGSSALNLWDIYRQRGRSRPVVVAAIGDDAAGGPLQEILGTARSYYVQRLSFLAMMTTNLRQRPVARDRTSRLWSGALSFRERL